jgi:hypothetical protein
MLVEMKNNQADAEKVAEIMNDIPEQHKLGRHGGFPGRKSRLADAKAKELAHDQFYVKTEGFFAAE